MAYRVADGRLGEKAGLLVSKGLTYLGQSWPSGRRAEAPAPTRTADYQSFSLFRRPGAT
jgi:hypothetical protein